MLYTTDRAMKGWGSCYARTRGVCRVFLARFLSVHTLVGQGLSHAVACAALCLGDAYCRYCHRYDCEHQHDHDGGATLKTVHYPPRSDFPSPSLLQSRSPAPIDTAFLDGEPRTRCHSTLPPL